MTTRNAVEAAPGLRLPDPPEREPDEVTAFDHIYRDGNNHHLAMHFGNLDTTLVVADKWVVASPEDNRARARRLDLLIAFDVSPRDYDASNGYIISEQGKPPDFVMEVASASTAEVDTREKREDYAALGIPEYWRFDETGADHGEKLAGDSLVGNAYQPIAIEELEPGVLQGYSRTLNLFLRWDHGRLLWIDPATEAPILTYTDQETRAEAERQARIRAEGRIRQLEEEVRRLRGE